MSVQKFRLNRQTMNRKSIIKEILEVKGRNSLSIQWMKNHTPGRVRGMIKTSKVVFELYYRRDCKRIVGKILY